MDTKPILKSMDRFPKPKKPFRLVVSTINNKKLNNNRKIAGIKKHSL